MQLSRLSIPPTDLRLLDLPERVLQFGTGVLLRALPDYFIDKANKQGIFNGRVVVVKSTEGETDVFARQDNLYTICVRGIEHGREIRENIIGTAISRVLAARTQWDHILACARNPELSIIISNTTEVGIILTDDDPRAQPPASFPGKLLALLWERWQLFNGAADKGFIIIPTELITNNGVELKRILLELAARNNMEPTFMRWVEAHNRFCNSLVDRIVPGKPADMAALGLPYEDQLLTMAEPFRLWAIEGNDAVKRELGFAGADAGVVIAPSIEQYKELKLRLLNGTHTFCCGPAFLSGMGITRKATLDPAFSVYMRKLMEEIAASIPLHIEEQTRKAYAAQVLERFANPSIDHQWISITLQYSSKMRMRNLPLLESWYQRYHTVPLMMATGFAGYIYFMKGVYNGEAHTIKDDKASLFHSWWQQLNADQVVDAALSSEALWGRDLRELPGFRDAVARILMGMLAQGVFPTLKQMTER